MNRSSSCFRPPALSERAHPRATAGAIPSQLFTGWVSYRVCGADGKDFPSRPRAPPAGRRGPSVARPRFPSAHRELPVPLIGAYQVLPGSHFLPGPQTPGIADRRSRRGDAGAARRPAGALGRQGVRGARGGGAPLRPSPPRAVVQSQDGGHHEEGGCRRC